MFLSHSLSLSLSESLSLCLSICIYIFLSAAPFLCISVSFSTFVCVFLRVSLCLNSCQGCHSPLFQSNPMDPILSACLSVRLPLCLYAPLLCPPFPSNIRVMNARAFQHQFSVDRISSLA